MLTASIGIHAHVPVAATPSGGTRCFCEKPVAATIEEVDALDLRRRRWPHGDDRGSSTSFQFDCGS